MPKVKGILKINFEVNLTLNETELRALDALVGYGIDPFLKVFYDKLGKAYMEAHEKGLRDIFQKIDDLRPNIGAIDKVKKQAVEVIEKYV